MTSNVTVTSTATIKTVSFTIKVYRDKSYSYTVNVGTTWATWVGSGQTLNTTKIFIRSGYVQYERGSSAGGYVRSGSSSKISSTTAIAAGTYNAGG